MYLHVHCKCCDFSKFCSFFPNQLWTLKCYWMLNCTMAPFGALAKLLWIVLFSYETVAVTLLWVILLLASHPQSQEMIYAELKTSTTKKSTLLEAFILETLRWAMATYQSNTSSELLKIQEWCHANKLIVNYSKTSQVIFKNHQKKINESNFTVLNLEIY